MLIARKKKINTRHVVVTALLAIMITSCRSNDDYNKLGVAGTKYIEAVNLLLDEAVKTKINLTSEQMIDLDRISNITNEDNDSRSKRDKERIESINRIVQHNSILKEYFRLLGELANSDSPQKAKLEIETVATKLVEVGNLITINSSTSASSVSTIGSGFNFIIKLQIREALKRELEKRGSLISNELMIQEKALKDISEILLRQKREITGFQEKRLVIRAITASIPIKNEEEWIASRQKILEMNIMSNKFSIASSALQDFRIVFQSFIEGKSDLNSINIFLTEVESFTKLVVEKK